MLLRGNLQDKMTDATWSTKVDHATKVMLQHISFGIYFWMVREFICHKLIFNEREW